MANVRFGPRECLVSRPGSAMVSVDYDAFEMRTVSQVCLWVLGYSDLADILNNPRRCPHVEMGGRIRGLSITGTTDAWDVVHAAAYGLKMTNPVDFKKLRGVAKGPNFGLWGGMRAKSLMDYCRLNYGVPLTIEEAQRAVDIWEEMYREAKPYLEWVKSQIGRGFGSRSQIRQFVSERLRGDVGYTDAANGYFQGLAADIAKAAGWRLVEAAYENRSSPLYGSRPLVFVHDEWIYEIPYVSANRFHDAAHEMAKIMVDTAREYCPDVLFSASPAAFFRWTKAAGDPMYGPDHGLLPYEIAKGLEIPKNQIGMKMPSSWL